LDEDAPPGADFLAQVCINWEKEAQLAEALGVRVVRARIGIVLGPNGGPLEAMARPFRLFVGGPIAGGKQVVSWVDLRDVVRAIEFGLNEPSVKGPVNLCAPEPVTNGQLSAAIAQSLGRPNYMPVPAFGLKVLFADGAGPITTGQRAHPTALLEKGFKFEHADLQRCLADNL
jgi:uncharacterized protein (TIGR01777 family)